MELCSDSDNNDNNNIIHISFMSESHDFGNKEELLTV